MIKTLKKKISLLDEHTLEVIKKSGSSMLVKVGGMIAGLIASIFLARIMGPDKYGIIAFTTQLVRFLLIVLMLGTEQFLIKETAIGVLNKEWKRINDWMKSAYLLNGIFTAIISLTLIALTPFMAKHLFHDERLEIPLIISFVSLTPQVLNRVHAMGLIGFRKVWQSNLSNEALSSVILVVMLAALYITRTEITVNLTSLIYATSAVCVTVMMSIYWKRVFPYKEEFTNKVKTLFKSSQPFFIVTISGVALVYADGILLGLFASTREVGLYNVAAKLALLTSFFLQISNSSISPKIASLYSAGKIRDIEKMVQQMTKYFLILGILPVITFALCGGYILGIFGKEFSSAYWILLILSFGQFVNIGTGSTGNLLIMTGNEKIHAKITGIFVFINVVLNITLILKFGALGAAVATAIAIAGENITKMLVAYKRTTVLTLPIKLKAA